jgi:hypothetical protein
MSIGPPKATLSPGFHYLLLVNETPRPLFSCRATAREHGRSQQRCSRLSFVSEYIIKCMFSRPLPRARAPLGSRVLHNTRSVLVIIDLTPASSHERSTAVPCQRERREEFTSDMLQGSPKCG